MDALAETRHTRFIKQTGGRPLQYRTFNPAPHGAEGRRYLPAQSVCIELRKQG
jgi:hypothetical protein